MVRNVNDLGLRNEVVCAAADLQAIYPGKDILPQVHEGNFNYMNKEAGWAESGKIVKLMIDWVVELGAKVIPGQTVKSFQEEGEKITGVVTVDGRIFEAEKLVLACGAWSEQLLHDTPLATPAGFLTASAQCIITIQLDEVCLFDHLHDLGSQTCRLQDRNTLIYLSA